MVNSKNQIKLHIEPYDDMSFRDFSKSMEGLAAFMDSQVEYTSVKNEKVKLYSVNHGSIEFWIGFANQVLVGVVSGLIVELIKTGIGKFINKHRLKKGEMKNLKKFLLIVSKGAVISFTNVDKGEVVELNKETADKLIAEIKSMLQQYKNNQI